MKVFRILSPILLALGLAGITPLASAMVWDLSSDFSTTNDGANDWLFGAGLTSGGGTFTAFDAFSSSGYPLNVDTHCFTNCDVPGDPNISKNNTGSTIDLFGITAVDQAVIFGPHPSSVAAQWTAAISGIYQIDAFFQDVQDCCGDRTPNGEILLNDVSFFGPEQVGQLAASTTLDYNATINLNAGDTLHFVVQGASDSTRVSATIESVSVSEPGTLGIISLGLLGLGYLRRKKV